MHTVHYEETLEDGTEVDVTLLFNQDLSGDISIMVGERSMPGEAVSIEVPADVLLRFVAFNYVLPRKTEKLEVSTVEELLL